MDIAVAGYLRKLQGGNHGDLLTAVNLMLESVGAPTFKDILEVRGELLFPEDVQSLKFLEAIAPQLLSVMDKDGKLPPEMNIGEIEGAKEELLKQLAAAEIELGPVPRYYAVLMMDGDEIGKWMSGDRPDPVGCPLTVERHIALSQTLTELGKGAMPKLLEDSGWPGVFVYSGGDDLMAVGTVAGVLNLAEDLRLAFSRGMGGDPAGLGEQATVSAAVVFAHCRDSLEKVLESAREALLQAKDRYGRNALALSLRYASGGALQAGCKWDLRCREPEISIGLVEFLSELLGWLTLDPGGLSPRFLYRVMESVGIFYEPDGRRPLCRKLFKAEARRLLKRHLPADSVLWTRQEPFSADAMLDVLGALADPQGNAEDLRIEYDQEANFIGLLKIVQFLCRGEGGGN